MSSQYSPRARTRFENAQSEKQISVDPISLRPESPPPRVDSEYSVMTMMYPVSTGPKMEVMSVGGLVSPRAKSSSSASSKFPSCSLPCSASSSPAAKQIQRKKKSKNGREVPGLGRQHSVALTNLERLRESHLQRSKSCGERRACQPSIDFDILSSTTTTPKAMGEPNNWGKVGARGERQGDNNNNNGNNSNMFQRKAGGGMDHMGQSSSAYDREQKFKCGALCLYLPGFGKAKVVRAHKEEEEVVEDPEPGIGTTERADMMVSKRVSLEKFECASWRSSAVINIEDQDGDAASNLFYDLPVELIRCSNVNDTESPVTTAFLFDRNEHDAEDDESSHHRVGHPTKGVLKNATAANGVGQQLKKSQESSGSSRQVRFSTSSPVSPITPRLRQLRDNFSAFLEAQSA